MDKRATDGGSDAGDGVEKRATGAGVDKRTTGDSDSATKAQAVTVQMSSKDSRSREANKLLERYYYLHYPLRLLSPFKTFDYVYFTLSTLEKRY